MVEDLTESRQGASIEEFSLRDIWSVLFQERIWILVSVIVITSLAGIYAFIKTPIYRATVVMVYVDAEKTSSMSSGLLGQISGLAALTGFSLEGIGAGGRNEVLATFRSRSFTEKFLIENDLLPLLFNDSWDEESGDWNVDSEEDIPTLFDAYELFTESVRQINEDPVTGIITLVVEWKDPELTSKWANELVAQVNKSLKTRAVEEAKRSIGFLNKELEKTTIVELQQAIYGLVEEQIQRAMLATVREAYAFRVIDPAFTSEIDEYVRPDRPVIIVVGAILGLVLGCALVFFLGVVKRR